MRLNACTSRCERDGAFSSRQCLTCVSQIDRSCIPSQGRSICTLDRHLCIEREAWLDPQARPILAMTENHATFIGEGIASEGFSHDGGRPHSRQYKSPGLNLGVLLRLRCPKLLMPLSSRSLGAEIQSLHRSYFATSGYQTACLRIVRLSQR